MMAYGVMTALVSRERFGVGQEVQASHLGSMAFLQGLSLSMKLMAGIAISAKLPLARRPTRSGITTRCRRRTSGSRSPCFRPTATGPTSARLIESPRARGRRALRRRWARALRSNAAECIGRARRRLREPSPATSGSGCSAKDEKSDIIYTIVNSVDDLRRRPPGQGQRLRRRNRSPPTRTDRSMVGVPVGLSETPGSVRRARARARATHRA